MRFVNTETLQLEEHVNDIPRYAILSHTWEEEEVTFQDMKDGKPEAKKGYSKIKRSSKQAAADHWEYIWIDTCCIDKSSSAELSEAINSMYQWYEQAEVCYAYLTDISGLDIDDEQSMSAESFRKSRWFTRGWTLQELIAPRKMVFYDRDWKRVGTKRTLKTILESVTEIEDCILQHKRVLEDVPVARKMSWAAKRQTTRSEDIAYCLMGIFGVNMPLLNGEGKKAFIRLQEEILKISDDHSLFAWTADHPSDSSDLHSGRSLFAESPADYAGSRHIVPFRDWGASTLYFMTNIGLSTKLMVERSQPAILDDDGYPIQTAVLNCYISSGKRKKRVGIHLKSLQGNYYVRCKTHRLAILSPLKDSLQEIFIMKEYKKVQSQDTIRWGQTFLLTSQIFLLGYRLMTIYPKNKWSGNGFYSRTNNRDSSATILRFKNDAGDCFWALIGSYPISKSKEKSNKFCLFRPRYQIINLVHELEQFYRSGFEYMKKSWAESFTATNGTVYASVEGEGL